METSDLTIEILKDIRSGIRSTNERIDLTNERIDSTNARLDSTNGRLETMRSELSQRIDTIAEGQVRLATEVVGVAAAVHELSDLLREDRQLRNRVDDHEKRIAAMERRAG